MRAACLIAITIFIAACGRPSDSRMSLGAAADDAGGPAFFACLRENNIALLAAHRGGPSSGYPENALETFAAVTASAPVLLEIDIRQGPGETLYLLHDATLDRTTTGAGPLQRVSRETLGALKLRDNAGRATGFSLPALSEALDWADGTAILELDIKDAPLEPVLEAIAQAGAREEVVIIADDLEEARRIHALDPVLMISAPIYSQIDLDDMLEYGPPASNLLAWTGTRTPDFALWKDIKSHDISIIYGALGRFDAAQLKRARNAGASLIVTDHWRRAARTLYGTNMQPDSFSCAAP